MVDKGLDFILGLVASLAHFGTGTRAYSDVCTDCPWNRRWIGMSRVDF